MNELREDSPGPPRQSLICILLAAGNVYGQRRRAAHAGGRRRRGPRTANSAAVLKGAARKRFREGAGALNFGPR